MGKKLFYGLVGFAAFFIVFQNVQAIAYDIWEWWEDRNHVYTPTYDSITATDAVERPVQKVRPHINGTVVAPRPVADGKINPRKYLLIPTHLQFSTGGINTDASDEIIVTAQKRSSLPQGLRLPKRSDRPDNKDGVTANKIRHSVQRSCSGTLYANLLLHNRTSGVTKPIFDVPLSVIGHQLIETDNQTSHVLVFTAIVDTSQDDKLTCQDFIHMAIFDIESDTLHWVDMGGSEPLVSNSQYGRSDAPVLRQLSETEYVMGVGLDENDDGLFNPKTEITEMAVLDIANKTFEKIVTAKDLENLQSILYTIEP